MCKEERCFETVTEAINDLTKRGYTHSFSLNEKEECIICHQHALILSPDEFQIDEIYRFEGETDPGDEMIVYGVSSKKYNVKGTIINAFGVYSDSTANKLVEKLLFRTEPKIKPIKRHPSIVSFSKDHHFGLLLVWKIRQGLNKAVSAERISNYILYFFKADLEKHFKAEEKLLFCKLPVDDALRKQAEAEHQAIYKLVAAIEQKKEDTVLLNQLADELEKHIRFEERELFNHLQNNINADDLEEIANRFPNSSKAIDEKWEDVFWDIKN